MNKPNLKNCTNKVKDYIKHLEYKISNLEKEVHRLTEEQEPSNVYQNTDFVSLNKRKIYMDDKHPVYFIIDGKEFHVYIQDGKELYISGDKTIKIQPRAWNCVTISHNE